MKFSVQYLKDFFLQHKITVFLILGVLVLVIGGFFAYKKFIPAPKVEEVVEEHELSFDPAGAYALLIPRRDGHAINLDVKRVSDYSSFSYQITYSDDKGIDRGAGSLDTWINIKDGQNEFTQEILFGTCSKGDTSDPLHCVFDTGVENGTLELHFKHITKVNSRLNKADVYKLTIPWHFQKPDVALGKLISPDTHFKYTILGSNSDLSVVGFSDINDLSGSPKLPSNKQVLGKVYALSIPLAKVLPKGTVSIELSDKPSLSAKIAEYVESQNDWKILDTKISGSTLTTGADGAGIFAVFIDSSSK
ncbi:hypothetical protein HY025_02535 [Candidatus Daviesbacteria bacterium]|nr:hypothetical protein [Candidatus Daviesbacteria bacterium]